MLSRVSKAPTCASGLFERRRQLMEAWSDYLLPADKDLGRTDTG